jgi:hypothetical protein
MEVAGHRVFTTPYTNVYALLEEMVAIQNPTPNQQWLKVILESTALQMQAAKVTSQANPSQGLEAHATTHSRLGQPGNQWGGQWVPVHSHLGPLGYQNRNQGAAQSAYRGHQHSNREGRDESSKRSWHRTGQIPLFVWKATVCSASLQVQTIQPHQVWREDRTQPMVAHLL